MKSRVLIFGFGLVAAFAAAGCGPTESSGDEDAVRTVIQSLDEAWNRGDGTAWAVHYAENGEFINVRGAVFEGRAVVEKHHKEILTSSFKGSKVKSVIRRLEWLGPDAVIVDTDFSVRDFKRLILKTPLFLPARLIKLNLHKLKC